MVNHSISTAAQSPMAELNHPNLIHSSSGKSMGEEVTATARASERAAVATLAAAAAAVTVMMW